MFIGLDESISGQHYVLGATISFSEQTTKSILTDFRKIIRSSNLKNSEIRKINQDPKEKILYDNFPNQLVKYLDLIANEKIRKGKIEPRRNLFLLAAYYVIREPKMSEELKFHAFELTFRSIMDQVFMYELFDKTDSYKFVFDRFDSSDQSDYAKKNVLDYSTQKYPHIKHSIEHGIGHVALNVADIVAGTSRRHIEGIRPNEFHTIKPMFINEPIKVN